MEFPSKTTAFEDFLDFPFEFVGDLNRGWRRWRLIFDLVGFEWFEEGWVEDGMDSPKVRRKFESNGSRRGEGFNNERSQSILREFGGGAAEFEILR